MKLYYIKVTVKGESSVTKLMSARDALKSFNKLYDVWGVLKEFNYTSIEMYKIGDNLPKRILL